MNQKKLHAIDKAGMTASTVCFVHCVITPIAYILIPFIPIGFILNENFEWALFFMAIIFGLLSVCMGYKKHKTLQAPALISGGLMLLLIGRLTDQPNLKITHLIVMLFAAATLITGHLLNRKLCASCDSCSRDHI